MSNKNNSGWILCPSKRFPGKFYYYNVINGESAWSFNESEKRFLRIDDKTQHVTQKCHRYPEPPSPPYRSQSSFTTTTVHQPFGHAIFPKYISHSTLKWTNPNQKTELTKMIKPSILRNIEPSTQRNIDSQTVLSAGDIVVESSKEPLSQRFSNFYQCLEIKKENQQESADTENIFLLKIPATKTSPLLQSVGQSGDLQLRRKCIEDSSFNSIKFEDKMNMIKLNKATELYLAENDLRYVLEAKRSGTTKEKADLLLKTSKKKVTFNIPDSEQDESSDEKEKEKLVITKPMILDKENSSHDYENIIRNSYSKQNQSMVDIETHKNLFLQKPEQFDPFLFIKTEHDISLASSKKSPKQMNNIILCADSINNNVQLSHFRNNVDQIISEDDISDLITNFREKLNIKNRDLAAPGNSGIKNFGSRNQENPFRIKKSVTKYKHIPNQTNSSTKVSIVVRVDNSDITNQLIRDSFENVSQKLIRNRKILLDGDISSSSFTMRNLFPSFTNISKGTGNHYLQDNILNVVQNSNPQCGENPQNFKNYRETSDFETNENLIDDKLRKFYNSNPQCGKIPQNFKNYRETSNVEANENLIDDKLRKFYNSNPQCGKNPQNFKNYRETSDVETNENLIDDKLRKFYIKNKVVEKSVILRMDELICCFTQIMEDYICNLLETSSCPPQYTLHDALLHVKTHYNQHVTVSLAVDKITDSHIFSVITGYIQNKVEPDELIKVIGSGILFIESLKELVDVDAGDAVEVLSKLLQDVEDPQYEDLPEPVVCAVRDEAETRCIINFMKSHKDIVSYLQKHFPEWQFCDAQNEERKNEEQNQDAEKNMNNNVLRASGKDLHRLKINSQNQLYKEEADKEIDGYVDNGDMKIVRNFKIIDKFECRLLEENLEDKSKINYNDKSENLLFKTYKNEINHKDFDEISPEFYELCNNDARYLKNIPNGSQIDDENDKNNKSVKLNDSDISKDKSDDERDKIEVSNEIQNSIALMLTDSDRTADVAPEDANQYYLLIKSFLVDLSSTLQLIYAFIDESLHRFHKGDITETNKKLLYEEANNTYIYLKDIIEKLKGIIERETRDESALRRLVAAADGAAEDKRVQRYRQVVSKCLEQARLLESSLKLLLHLADEDCTLSVSSDLCDTTYINIFE